MRMTVQPPMATDTNNLVVLRSLEDAAYSIAEALRLAASRHPQLDLYPPEFGAGFRIVPSGNAKGQLFLDIYLYDTRWRAERDTRSLPVNTYRTSFVMC
jgi:hypothetical protein